MLVHDNIAKVIDFFENYDYYYLIMEYMSMDAINLNEYLARTESLNKKAA
jgi:hypothetical protein